jgi:tetratricopeptide (TPR) repeat protein
VSPFLGEWFASDPDITRKVAVLTVPDVWFSADLEPVSAQVLFRGESKSATVDVERLVRDEIAYLDSEGKFVQEEARRPGSAERWNQWSLRHIGKVANNLGVYLQDRDRSDLAFDLYRRSHALDTNNLSALINLHTLARLENRPEKDAIEAELAAEIKRQTSKAGLWSLSQEFGYVRSPELYTRRGWAWTMSGKPNLAIRDMKHALELSGDNPEVQLALARLYLAQHEMGLSEEQYLGVLDGNPHSMPALLGLARLATFKGDYDGARGYLAKLKDENLSPSILRLEEAVVDSSAGEVAKAQQLIAQVLQDEPNNPKALMVMAVVALQANDQEKLQAALAKLNAAKLLPPGIRLAAARLALNQGNRKAARQHLDALVRLQPKNAEALELLLRIDVYERQRDLAEEHAELLVKADPQNAHGNLMVGIFQAMKEEYNLAESSFRASLAAQRTDMVLNELAWLLVKKGRLDEAYTMVKESLEMTDTNGSAWDTLGEIEMLRGNLDAAEQAFQKALGFKPDDADVVLHMAKLLEKKGMFKEALRLADGLLARPTDLGKNDYEELRALVKRLRTST